MREQVDQVTDVLMASGEAIEASDPACVDDVRRLKQTLVRFSSPMRVKHLALKRFLREHVYRHYRVRRMSVKAARVVRELFGSFLADPRLLPDEARDRVLELEAENGRAGRARAVADYIAGMTDRFAIAEHQRIFDAARLT